MGTHEKNAALADGKDKAASQLTVPFWRFVTVELLLYCLCHLTCLYVLLFAAGDARFSEIGRSLLRHFVPSSDMSSSGGGPFDFFRNCRWMQSSPSHKVSADLVLTLLLPFTSNAFFLALMRRIDDVVAYEERQKNADGGPSQTPPDAVENDSKKKKWKSVALVKCDGFLRNCMVAKAVVLCLVIPICVFTQPANEMRAVGPVVVLLSIAAGLCALEVHGGPQSLRKLLSGMQVCIMVLLVLLSAEANLFIQS